MTVMKNSKKLIGGAVLAASMLGVVAPSQAAVTQIEGSAGSGIVPWAMLPGSNPTAAFTWINVGDFSAFNIGVSANLWDRLELSFMRDVVHLGNDNVNRVTKTLGNADGNINLDVFGAKLKVLDMSDVLPQVAVGVQYKRTDLSNSVIDVLNGDNNGDDTGIDYYVAATKVFKVAGWTALVNLAVRYTEANQIGILGFHNNGDVEVGFTGAFFVREDVVFGFDYRTKPDDMNGGPNGFKEDDWWDVFMAWFPNKNLAIVAAYANLGDIVKEAADLGENTSAGGTLGDSGGFADTTNAGEDQQGLYLQFQVNFDLM